MGNRLIKIEEFVLSKCGESEVNNISHGLIVISKTKLLDRENKMQKKSNKKNNQIIKLMAILKLLNLICFT